MLNTRNSELCQQTKDSIANAAVDLLLAEPGAELSVTRLCRQAGVSRNAFYRNFDAVEEVVGYYLRSRWIRYASSLPDRRDLLESPGRYLIIYIYGQRPLLRSLREKQMLGVLEKMFLEVLGPDEGTPPSLRYHRNGMAFLIYGLVRTMIENDFTETPEEVFLLMDSVSGK